MPSKKYRVGFVRFFQESNSFSSVDTTLKDFMHNVEDDELLERCSQRRNWEIDGFLRNLELSGFIKAANKHEDIEPVPLFSMAAITGGPLSEETYNNICNRFRKKLQDVGHLDGLMMCLHGALDARNILEPEADFINIARVVLGKDIPIGASFDGHAILTAPKVNSLDIICGYKTNPHRDFARTGHQAGDLLIRTIKKEITPTIAWRSIPMVTGGGAGMDFMAPMASVYRRCRQMEKIPGVLSASIYICHPFLDHPDTGWGVHVTTDNQPELGEKLADELAERCWEVREHKPPTFFGIEKVMKRARKAFLARKTGTVTICDASDVVGAGGTGENTRILKYLLENEKKLKIYIPLRDPTAVDMLWSKKVGDNFEIEVGGRLQPELNEAVLIKGTLLAKKSTQAFERVVAVDLGNIKLVITEGFAFAVKPNFYTAIGLSAWKPDITVVKSFFHFRWYYLLFNRKSLYARTKGITDLDVLQGATTNDPVYPKVDLEDWRAIDWKRRGISPNAQVKHFVLGKDKPILPKEIRRSNRQQKRLEKTK